MPPTTVTTDDSIMIDTSGEKATEEVLLDHDINSETMKQNTSKQLDKNSNKYHGKKSKASASLQGNIFLISNIVIGKREKLRREKRKEAEK